MKRFCPIVVSLLFPFFICAQQVTTFLGIPVDGSKSEMIQKLKEKGFRSTIDNPDILEGEFNGHDVNIHVVTNKNKVYRIMVCDVNPVDETAIRIRFNTLCEQFANNPRYNSEFVHIDSEKWKISKDDDIAYEILVKKKRYGATFYQQEFAIVDTLTLLEENFNDALSRNEDVSILVDLASKKAVYGMNYLEQCFKREVWFMISEFKGKYYISMYYDNKYNEANGEDL